MRVFYSIFLMLNPLLASAQCSCLENLDSLSNSVEVNYIAFQKKIEAKGGYTLFLDSLREQAKVATDFKCYENVLKAYLTYFNDPHLKLNLVAKGKNIEVIKSYFKDWPVISITRDSIIRYFNLNKPNPIEGIWQLKSLKTDIAIFRNDYNKYVGVILQADSILWNVGQVRMELMKNGDAFDIKYYSKDHTPIHTTAYLQRNTLIIQGINSWRKIYPNVAYSEPAEGIRFETIGKDAGVIAINDFLIDKKSLIDSVIKSNDSLISNRKYLIIDLRNNGGGHIMSTFSILPYLYTKPVKMDGLQVKSSPENIQIYKELRNAAGFSDEDKQAFDSIIYKLENHPNEIVTTSGAGTFVLDSTKSNPLIVGILANETTFSAAELFILWAKQSDKVILFGRSTGGALDNTEIGRTRQLPCSVFSFICPMGAGDHSSSPYIDNIGIKPDVELDYESSDWIETVYNYLKNIR